jgi:Holliday junction resolvase RusA-like endonuclease
MTRTDVLVVEIDCNPGELAINAARKAVILPGRDGKPRARLVEVGSVRKAKERAAAVVWKAAVASPNLARLISTATLLEVEIDAYWPRRRALSGTESLALGDVDAPIKLVIDLLEESHLIDDDARVVEVRARKFMDRERPRIVIRVMPHLVGQQQLLEVDGGGT